MLSALIPAINGGSDPGACGNGLKEKDITLKLGQLVAVELKNYQVDVVMARDKDNDVTLIKRVQIANERKADLFLSLHVNAGGGTGFESYIDVGAAETTVGYQRIIHEAIKLYISPTPDRGKKVALNPRFYVLRYTHMPAVLLEILFIDHPEDAKYLGELQFLHDLAKAIAAGVIQALKIEIKGKDKTESAWDPQAEITRLKERGLILGNKGAVSAVSWGELATVLNRILDREEESECKCKR